MKIFYYLTPSGKSPVMKFIKDLPEETRFEVLTLLRRLEFGEIISFPHVRSMSSIGHGLYEMRIRDEHGHVRIFYYTKIRDSIFLLHALRKKSNTIPDKDRLLILKRIKELQFK